jgi:hypothetical protein
MTLHFLNRRVGHLLARLVVVAALVGGIAQTANADDTGQARLQRVRSDSPAIAAAIREATERSATFRRLVDTIDTTNGLVYVDEGVCGHSVRACLVLSVTVAGPFRLLRILIDTRKRTDQELMGSIGHELQHAVEVLSDPNVTDFHRVYSFYQREGPTGRDRFETEAALQAGLNVLAEARDWAKGR